MAKLTKRMRVIREKVDATKQYDINVHKARDWNTISRLLFLWALPVKRFFISRGASQRRYYPT